MGKLSCYVIYFGVVFLLSFGDAELGFGISLFTAFIGGAIIESMAKTRKEVYIFAAVLTFSLISTYLLGAFFVVDNFAHQNVVPILDLCLYIGTALLSLPAIIVINHLYKVLSKINAQEVHSK